MGSEFIGGWLPRGKGLGFIPGHAYLISSAPSEDINRAHTNNDEVKTNPQINGPVVFRVAPRNGGLSVNALLLPQR